MLTRRVVISAHNGAHARPVAELARLALTHQHPVVLRTSTGDTVDVSSVLAVMDLGLKEGDEITLETSIAPESAELLDAMSSVLAPPMP